MVPRSTLVARTDSTLPPVGVIGLGPMGAPMAHRLLGCGLTVSAWNRSTTPAERFRAAGGTVVASVRDLTGDVVLSALPDVDQLRDVLAASGGPDWLRGRNLVVMSTTSPRKVCALQADLADYGVAVVDAPVSGGITAAAAGTLSIMVGARPEDFARVNPVLHILSTTLEHVGELGSGSVAKLCNQVVVASTLTALAQASAMATRRNVPLDKLFRLLAGGLADSAVLRAKGERLASGDYIGGGSARNQLKDLRYAVEVADDLGLTTSTIIPVLEAFEALVDRGLGELDHSAVRLILDDC